MIRFYNMYFKIKIDMLLFDTIFVLVFFLQKLSNDMILSWLTDWLKTWLDMVPVDSDSFFQWQLFFFLLTVT